jgi:hypothetical protein
LSARSRLNPGSVLALGFSSDLLCIHTLQITCSAVDTCAFSWRQKARRVAPSQLEPLRRSSRFRRALSSLSPCGVLRIQERPPSRPSSPSHPGLGLDMKKILQYTRIVGI